MVGLKNGISQNAVRCDFEAEVMVDEAFNASTKINRKQLIEDCNMLCRLKLENMVDERNLTKAEGCKDYLEKHLKDGEMKPKLIAANAECVRYSNLHAELRKNSIEKKKICSPAAFIYMTCLVQHIQMYCPEDKLSKTEHCVNEIKKLKVTYDV
uniref:Chemosensory protein n=1 Tax=Blattella germanica TaxID=6973 RepID=A0A120HTV0_BLAGE|nr:chemosensory protein [Blattella germanica]